MSKVRSYLKVYSLSEFLQPDLFPPVKDIVSGLIGAGEFIVFSGPAKIGKSIFSANLALAVAFGRPFLGRFACSVGRVLVMQTEISGAAYSDRLRQMVGMSVPSDIPLSISMEKVKLNEKDGLRELRSYIEGEGIELVILDPFYKLHRGNEDSASEMGPLLTQLSDLAHQTQCVIFLVHHQGKKREHETNQVGHQARGSSSFGDVPDASWSIRSTKDGIILGFEMRNRETPEPILLVRDSNLEWMASENQTGKIGRLGRLVEMVKDVGSISRKELIKAVEVNIGIKERQTQELINCAVSKGLIERKLLEGKAIFFAPKEDTAGMQSTKVLHSRTGVTIEGLTGIEV